MVQHINRSPVSTRPFRVFSNRSLIWFATSLSLLEGEMPNYCLECGGNLTYDPAIKQYACKSCGLTFTQQDLLQGREKMLQSHESADEEKKRRQKEYLK